MKEITRQWLDSAGDDLSVIEKIISFPGLSNMVAFHAQQAIEKSIKGYIEEKDIFLPKTHDLIRLYKLSGLSLNDDELIIIQMLNDSYINSRYPGEIGLLPNGKPSEHESKLFLEITRTIVNKISNGIANR